MIVGNHPTHLNKEIDLDDNWVSTVNEGIFFNLTVWSCLGKPQPPKLQSRTPKRELPAFADLKRD